MWEIKVFGNQKLKEKYLGNQLEFDRNEEQNKDPKSLFFFDFSNPLKQRKMNPFGSKNTFENLYKTLVNRRNFALGSLREN